MDAQELETILLSSATEDYFALYEAVWEINSRFPGETLGRKYDAVANALLNLQRQGWIRFERKSAVEGSLQYQAISDQEVNDILKNPVSWYPEYNGMTIGFSATDAGMKHYTSGRE